MDLDDLLPRKKPAGVTLGEDLSRLSIPDLEARLALLDDERRRVEAEIDARKATRAAADAVFKS
ncbi:MAG: DUF1192 domain-containing protein [Hyphomicrobiaceae bacterium]